MTAPSIRPKAVRERRKRLGLRLQDVADRMVRRGVPVTPSTLSRWETGAVEPSGPWAISALARSLGCAVRDIAR